jgi:hypothetical protein
MLAQGCEKLEGDVQWPSAGERCEGEGQAVFEGARWFGEGERAPRAMASMGAEMEWSSGQPISFGGVALQDRRLSLGSVPVVLRGRSHRLWGQARPVLCVRRRERGR